MSFKVIESACIGCGGCEYACPTGALTKTDSFLGLFAIDPFTCDDCGLCVGKCPEAAIVTDTTWAICGDKGCPLSSKRLDDMECAVWQERCPTCGTTMWHRVGEDQWACPRCDYQMRVKCPRTRRLPTHESIPVELTTAES